MNVGVVKSGYRAIFSRETNITDIIYISNQMYNASIILNVY